MGALTTIFMSQRSLEWTKFDPSPGHGKVRGTPLLLDQGHVSSVGIQVCKVNLLDISEVCLGYGFASFYWSRRFSPNNCVNLIVEPNLGRLGVDVHDYLSRSEFEPFCKLASLTAFIDLWVET